MTRSGYDDGMLTKVITATDTAIGEMNTLNSTVTGISGMLPSVNNSTSGIKLAQLLSNWTTDYQKIIGELQELHGKAQGLLIVNRNTESETTGSAQ